MPQKTRTKRKNIRRKTNKSKMNKSKKNKSIKRKRTGGASSSIAQSYNRYREKLTAKNDVNKLHELETGEYLTKVLNELVGAQNASKIMNAARIKYLDTYGDLNVKLLFDFDNFGLVYECDFTDDGETMVVTIYLSFPNNVNKRISHGSLDDFDAALDGMDENDKRIVRDAFYSEQNRRNIGNGFVFIPYDELSEIIDEL